MTPRLIAATNGRKHYKASPCKACQCQDRYTSSGACVDCVNRKANDRQKRIRAMLKGAI